MDCWNCWWGFDAIHDTGTFQYEVHIMKNMWPGQLKLHQQDFLKVSESIPTHYN